jgi:hypothetical protein
VSLWEKNPRGIKTKDYERLKKQIEKLGDYKPLVACRENGGYTVLGGNMRLRAYRELGRKEVELSVVEAKTEAKKIEYAMSDNDRAGFYEEDALAELVYPHIDELDLSEFKVDLGEPWIDLKNVIERSGPGGLDPAAAWEGMPEYQNEDQSAYMQIIVSFKSQDAVNTFAKLIGQKLPADNKARQYRKTIWYPEEKIERMMDKRYSDEP